MVEGHRVDWAELGQVVLIGCIVAVPGNHVEGGEGLVGCGKGLRVWVFWVGVGGCVVGRSQKGEA